MLTQVLVKRQFDLVIMRDSLKPCIDPGLALANAYRDVPGDGCDLRASRQGEPAKEALYCSHLRLQSDRREISAFSRCAMHLAR